MKWLIYVHIVIKWSEQGKKHFNVTLVMLGNIGLVIQALLGHFTGNLLRNKLSWITGCAADASILQK